jgi:hypothetical protein
VNCTEQTAPHRFLRLFERSDDMTSRPPTIPQKRSSSLASLVVLLIVGLALMVSLLAFSKWRFVPAELTDDQKQILGTTVLADGTTLKLVGFTTGKYHELYFFRPPAGDLDQPVGKSNAKILSVPADGNRSLVWLTRHRGESPWPIEFDGLRRAKLQWGANRSVATIGVQRVFFRPEGEFVDLDPRFPLTTPGPEDLVFTLLSFPMISDPGQPVTLRLFGEHSGELAAIELTVPRSGLASTEVWKPFPMPQTQTSGRYSATLKAIVCKEEDDGRVTVRADVDMAIDGRGVAESTRWIDDLQDPIGNDGNSHRCCLDHGAAAWKVRIGSWMPTGSTIETGTAWKTPELPVPTNPEEMTPLELFGDLTDGRAGVCVSYICGPKCPPLDVSPWWYAGDGWTHSGDSTTLFGKPVQAAVSGMSGSPLLSVSAEFPFVCICTTGLGWLDLLTVTEVRDDQSRKVPFVHWTAFVHEGLTLCILDPLPDAKSVTLSFATYTKIGFEFMIAPPPVAKP